MRIAATPARLSVVRAVAVDIAMREDFDVDAIADLRMAVDEACSTLVTLAAPGAVLSCQFCSWDDGIHVFAVVRLAGLTMPTRESFGWQVLTALTDSVQMWTESVDGESGSYLVHIDLAKRRAQVRTG